MSSDFAEKWYERPGYSPPLVSVIIRTKDRKDFLHRALESVAIQTYPAIEAVVVNDGDSEIGDVLSGFSDTIHSIMPVSPANHSGRVKAANAGLEAASGSYFIFLDDDDWFYQDHLEKLVQALEKDADFGVAYTGIECKRQDVKTGELVNEHQFNQPFENAFLLFRNFIPIHAAMFRRSFVDDGLRLDESLSHYEDWDFWLQLSRKTHFKYIPGISACYFLGSSSGFGVTEEEPKQLASQARFFSKWRKLWSEDEIRAMVEFARLVPDLRQKCHEAQVRTQKVLEAHQHDIDLLRKARLQNSELLQETQQTTNELLHAREEYQRILNSTSWRLTAPLRVVMFRIRKVSRSLQNFYLRIKNAIYITRRGGIAAYLAYVKKKRSGSLSSQLELAAELHKILPVEYAQVAGKISLPQVESPVVSVIIPVYNHLDMTLACLLSIEQYSPDIAMEVLVVDDASGDESEQLLPAIENLRYLRNPENLGFVHSCNRGAEEARGEYVLFLNNDTQVTAGWLDNMLQTIKQRDKAGIVGAKLVYPSGHLQEAGANLHRDGTVSFAGLNQDPDNPLYNRTREVDHCSGACLLISRSLFSQVDGFTVDYAPAFFEDCDLSLKVRKLGYQVIYEPTAVIIHHLSVTTNELKEGKIAQNERNKKIYLQRWEDTLTEEDKVRLIAFYLPQYHPIPENDEWWGKGFTEWNNVSRAIPNFEGHYQPHLPADLGYYDLRLTEVREEQARLAREYGVYGFCYYYYWFAGKKLLERPLNEMLSSGTPDFPFCICWANESWSRRWDGQDNEVLMAQDYSSQSSQQFINELLPVFEDSRYIRVNDRPMLLIYRAEQIPDLEQTVNLWRETAKQQGLELYLCAVESFNGLKASTEALFDALIEFPPHGGGSEVSYKPEGLNPEFQGTLYDYRATAANFMKRKVKAEKVFHGVMPSWDNTARRQLDPNIFIGANPFHYQNWLQRAVSDARSLHRGDERLVFVNAWNEWAEGNHLEPDKKFGHGYLEATRSALGTMGYYHPESVNKPAPKD